MMKITSLAGISLECVQRTILKQEFDLRTADAVLGTFRFTDVFKRHAVAEEPEATWAFERKGLWRPRVLVRDGRARKVAEIPWNSWGDIRIHCTMARVVRLKRGNWKRTDYELVTDMNFPLIRIARKSGLTVSLSMTLTERGGQLAECPWVLWFGIFTCLSDASGKRRT